MIQSDLSKGDVCTCNISYEHGLAAKFRPVVIWDNLALTSNRPTVLVIPFTTVLSKQRYEPTKLIKKSPDNNLDQDSILKIYQFGCVSKNTIGERIGNLTEDEIESIKQLIKKHFSI